MCGSFSILNFDETFGLGAVTNAFCLTSKHISLQRYQKENKKKEKNYLEKKKKS